MVDWIMVVNVWRYGKREDIEKSKGLGLVSVLGFF